MALGLSLFSQPSLEVNADTNLERDWLTFEEIDQKFEEINGKYDIGEEMNIEDQEFVKNMLINRCWVYLEKNKRYNTEQEVLLNIGL